MKPTLLLFALAILGFAQAGSIAGMPGTRRSPRWNESAPRSMNRTHRSFEYRPNPPGSGFNRPVGLNPYRSQLNGPNSPNSFMPPHGAAGR